MNRPILSPVKNWLPLTAAVFLLAAVAAILWLSPPAANPDDAAAPTEARQSAAPEPTPSPTPALITPPGTKPAPEFRGITAWLNSEPLAMAELRGQVVLVDIWTYS